MLDAGNRVLDDALAVLDPGARAVLGTLVDSLLSGLAARSGVHRHGRATDDGRTPTFAVTVDGHAPDAVARHMADAGIAVWSGHYYAVELMRALGLLDTGGAVRIGFVHYHGPDDVDRVLSALHQLT